VKYVYQIEVMPETVTEEKTIDGKKQMVETTNLERVSDEIAKALGSEKNYMVRVHEDHHGEINTPCSPWQVVDEKGKIEEIEEMEMIK